MAGSPNGCMVRNPRSAHVRKNIVSDVGQMVRDGRQSDENYAHMQARTLHWQILSPTTIKYDYPNCVTNNKFYHCQPFTLVFSLQEVSGKLCRLPGKGLCVHK